MGAVKVATCCYCGAKAALVLRGQTRHELSCGNCGAPLSRMKMLPKAAAPAAAPVHHTTRKAAKSAPKSRRVKPKKRKYRKGLFRHVLEEIWGEIEDIFD